MEVALPMAAAANMDCYEDMFKEITRKLYGEEGLQDNNGEGGTGGGSSNSGGGSEGGIATSMRAAAAAAAAGVGVMPDYEGEGNGGGFKPDDGHHSHGALTAFGLAALMQNGFPPPPGMLSAHHHFQDAKYRGGAVGVGGGGHHHHLHHHHTTSSSDNSNTVAEDKWVSSEEVLQWTSSKIASYNPAQKLFRCSECECVGFLSRVAEHWLGTHANLRVFQCPQCPYSSAWARCVRMHLTRQHNVTETPGDGVATLYKENPVLEEVTKFLQRLKTKVETAPTTTNNSGGVNNQKNQHEFHHQPPVSGRTNTSTDNQSTKRYSCTYCPYATDRRDLFTRHENIHREEKPFQCYVCQKQFNRADHVKKHFLRMHRDYPYDLNRIRRQPPKNASGMSYYHKYNNNSTTAGSNNTHRQHDNQNNHQAIMTPQIHQVHQHHNLNIPGGFSPVGLRPGTNLPPISKPKSQPPPPQHNHNGCNAKSHGSKTKKKGEKRYSCCYCAWSGVDNWCLKRHLNTHLKPFVCVLCDYKAARSERLATHVLKVHNKRACGRCSFLADDQAQLSIHLQEHQNQNVGSTNNSHGLVKREHFELETVTASAVLQQHGRVVPPPNLHSHHNSGEDQYMRATKQHYGAARLFHYMEASDTSDPEENGTDYQEEEEEEPPPFICRECGCEFVDDTSLETHDYTHHHTKRPLPVVETTSSSSKPLPYQCSVCGCSLASQMAMMEHMRTHTGLVVHCRAESCDFSTPLGTDTLREHVATLHGNEGGCCTARCPHCGLALGTGDAIKRHQGQHHDALEKCALCDAIFRKHFASTVKDNVNNNVCNNRRCSSSGVTDSNMNHSTLLQRAEDHSSRDGTTGSKRSRKQSQPRRVVPDVLDSEMEIQVLRHPGFLKSRLPKRKHQTSAAEMSQLRDKYVELLLARKGLKCNWCRQEMFTFPYHTAVSLAFHQLWRHTRTKFQCEHCEHAYRHRYQVVLHASREHVTIKPSSSRRRSSPSSPQPPSASSEPVTVPEPSSKEPKLSPVPAPTESSFSSINVPDLLVNPNTTVNISLLRDPKPCHIDSSMLNTPLAAPIPPKSSSSSSPS
ncbi:zinc finger protein 624 isoform X2 [Cryptotermes secundus]|uniref:zinc finger protein 624 isoform X2 n=1 Tax=Cryptotermes secundus TaxID=105785 RepID=UPI001454C30A|nr:zinc finger protein 624 isoform X2 [Cryptotermes secundus]